jgi:hypothetical protein
VGSGSENRRVPLLKIKNAAATTDVGHP